ncbi:penicillin acylase family protein [Phenylobacterium montanum]|uniref:Penicillin acylase family protein n=1 Tax=Phenylobacterium montanum TaxID=2823693 RepID=A0A975FYV1_9CAUL|nr:penicillin acylase family protein [Caulobacter sp. S6]QUD87383.1 penicillin acylase family protein [Caulobacter sp. S6]
MRRIGMAALAAVWAMAAAQAGAATPGSARQDQLAVPGLDQTADILVDRWGVPHIYAGDDHDAFFLQGWNAARDRLWQMDLWRKRGLGLLSKSFGPGFAEEDRAARLFLYRGDMAAEWAAYGPRAQSRTGAFVAGINAYVAAVRAGKAALPVEFQITHSQPDDWAAEDVVRIRSHALTGNITTEVARARMACLAGLAADHLRQKIEPPWTVETPKGLDPCDVPADVLHDYQLATKEVAFQPEQKQLAWITTPPPEEGSNNWTIAPSRTATGRPILANDPHRGLGIPSIRYLVQLNAPGLDVIGAGEPAQPGVIIGHNDKIAFGLTIFAIDQQDLYVYDLNPADPHQYRYQGRWEPMQVVRQSLEVKGQAPREIELDFTRHGPVIYVDEAHHKAFALRTNWSEPGTAGYFGTSELLSASDWTSFRAAMTHWGTPSENMIFADTAGHIGWQAVGRSPIRPNWDGLLPVPGDGRYEWKGFLTLDQLPHVYDPPEGWFASANAINLPADYPYKERKVAFEWSDPSRIQRIDSVLGANGHVSLADSMALQMDDFSTVGLRLTALLKPLHSDDPQVAQALSLLTAWDGHESIHSPAAALYEVWSTRHLGAALAEHALPAPARPLMGGGSLESVTEALETADPALGADPKAARDAILLESLKAAVTDVSARLGPNPATWSWGRLHHAEWAPSVAILADPATRAQMSVGPLEVRGGASTPAASSYTKDSFNAASGATTRLDMDVGAWDNSMAINGAGQSGDPFDPHYRDLFPLWAGGSFIPLLFTRPAVEAATERVIHLTPAP